MNLKLDFLHYHDDFFLTYLEGYGKEQGERFHQDVHYIEIQ